MNKFLVIVMMMLVSSVYAQTNNSRSVGNISLDSDYDKISKVYMEAIANERFETVIAMDSGELMLKKETREALIALLKEGIRLMDIHSYASKVIELGRVESDDKFNPGYISLKYINFADTRLISINVKYGVNINKAASINKEEALKFIDILEKSAVASTELLAELDKLK